MPTLWIPDIFDRIQRSTADSTDPSGLIISPCPSTNQYYKIDEETKETSPKAAAGIDLRLGCYFIVFDRNNLPFLEPGSKRKEDAAAYQSEVYIPLGYSLCLQPGEFVLGATLEWLRLPTDLSAYVIGKSSLGRTGLIIETAGMIHPAFTGCLTLEISNLSGVPVMIFPGMDICQVVFHNCSAPQSAQLIFGEQSVHTISRKPRLGNIIENKRISAIVEQRKKIYTM
jgi:dCTP deaminase